MRDLFESSTELDATANFGAWTMLPVGDRVMLGLGNSPGNEDGALIASTADGVTVVNEQVLAEQGVHALRVIDGTLYVPGTDPFAGWDLGLIYTRLADGTWVTQRTLPLVIHALGVYRDGATLWVAAGCHTGDSATWRGRALKSVDDGQTWAAIDVNNYRLYDVIGFADRLYATGYNFTGSAYTYDLHASSDLGMTWPKVSGISPASKPRLLRHNSELIGVRWTLGGLFRIANDGSSELCDTPFVVANHWNVLDSDGTWVYVLDSYGRVWRTTNFSSWEHYTTVTGAISIVWWPGHGLLVGCLGQSTRIWIATAQ